MSLIIWGAQTVNTISICCWPVAVVAAVATIGYYNDDEEELATIWCKVAIVAALWLIFAPNQDLVVETAREMLNDPTRQFCVKPDIK